MLLAGDSVKLSCNLAETIIKTNQCFFLTHLKETAAVYFFPWQKRKELERALEINILSLFYLFSGVFSLPECNFCSLHDKFNLVGYC